MKAVALLSWFDESPEMLRDVVASWAELCSGLVAVDGPYRDFPSSRNISPPEQHRAINAACDATGMTLRKGWFPRGTQAEQRTHAWRIGEAMTEPDDWFLVVDADEALIAGSRAALRIAADVGEVLTQTIEGYAAQQRRWMRAIRGVRVVGRHYHYVTPAGESLWAHPDEPAVPAVRTDIRLDHQRDRRGPTRLAAQDVFYRERVER